jgi:hypothetical protein
VIHHIEQTPRQEPRFAAPRDPSIDIKMSEPLFWPAVSSQVKGPSGFSLLVNLMHLCRLVLDVALARFHSVLIRLTVLERVGYRTMSGPAFQNLC